MTGDIDIAGPIEIEITSSTVTSVRLTGVHLVRPRISDSRFERCELSGAIFEEAVLERVEFVDCRLSGAILSDAKLRHVRFRDCRLDGALMRMVAGSPLVMERCQLASLDLYGADLRGAEIIECDLTGADLSQANLAGAHLYRSDLTDITGGASLRNVAIDSSQIIPIALVVFEQLGITIHDA